MGCGFCATGQMGLQNNLTAGEIAAQAVWAGARPRLPDTTPQRLSNVVFMGMGEPLANERHVSARSTLLDRAVRASALGTSRSRRSAWFPASGASASYPQVGLAVSLHAATTSCATSWCRSNRAIRSRADDAIAAWRAITRRRPSIEWAMIDRLNDTDEQAELLAPIARRLGAHVNLSRQPDARLPVLGVPAGGIGGFVQMLETARRERHRRDTRGRSIDAACGQLALAATS